MRVLLSMLVLALGAAGCGAKPAPVDPALRQFVVGTWIYDGPYTYRGTRYEREYRLYTFESGPTVWISTGEDGSQCAYEFASRDVIRVNCGGGGRELQALSVRREGESLVLQELDGRLAPLGEALRFERVRGG